MEQKWKRYNNVVKNRNILSHNNCVCCENSFKLLGSLDIKHQTKVVGIKDSDCDSKYRRYKRKLSSSQYCVAGDDESDFCYGDAPILAMDDSKHWYVSGISSYGAPCGKKGWPDVVTRVSSYKDWIINVCTSDYDK